MVLSAQGRVELQQSGLQSWRDVRWGILNTDNPGHRGALRELPSTFAQVQSSTRVPGLLTNVQKDKAPFDTISHKSVHTSKEISCLSFSCENRTFVPFTSQEYEGTHLINLALTLTHSIYEAGTRRADTHKPRFVIDTELWNSAVICSPQAFIDIWNQASMWWFIIVIHLNNFSSGHLPAFISNCCNFRQFFSRYDNSKFLY